MKASLSFVKSKFYNKANISNEKLVIISNDNYVP